MGFLDTLLHDGPIETLNFLNNRFSKLAEDLDISDLWLFIMAGLIALMIGLAGMHLAKIFCTIGMGGIGFISGVELFKYLTEKVDFMADWHVSIGFVLGGLVAALFLFFGWKKCLYVMFALFAAAGYALVAYLFDYSHEYLWIAVGSAVLVAMLASMILKVAFVLFTSGIGGFALVSFLSGMLPKVEVLKLGVNSAAIWIAIGAALVMAVIQFGTTRNYNIVKH